MIPIRPRRRFRDVRLFWKILLPFGSLVVLIGVFGSFLTVRGLSTQARSELDQELLRDSLEARSLLHDREFDLLEAANFAANIEGMNAAMRERDAPAVERSLSSVLALKSQLDLMVAVSSSGETVVEFARPADGSKIGIAPKGEWSNEPLVERALRSSDAVLSVGIIRAGSRDPLLAVGAPVCDTPTPCEATGMTLAALRLRGVLSDALALVTSARADGSEAGVALHDEAGRRLAAVGLAAPENVSGDDPRIVRRRAEVDGREIETLNAPFELGNDVAGRIAVTRPTGAAFASARATGQRLALLVLLAMLGVVGAGALLTRLILGQVRPLVEGNRAFGEGDLSSRVPVSSRDEIGELAAGFNHMAEQIQGGYETLEQRVAERTAEIQRLLEQRTEFFTGVSHEFRTTLAVIRGEAELLRDPTYARSAGQRAEVASILDGASGQLRAFIDDVLTIARAEAGGLEIETTEVDAKDVLSVLRPTAKSLARASDLKLSFDVPQSLPRVRANADRLRDVLLSLMDNAAKYTPAGGELVISAERENGEVRLSVADSGPGIPPDVGDHVFEAFYRVKGTRQQRGEMSSGLGLAIARHSVEAQGGRIWFESSEGEGTTFTVAFPVVQSKRRRNARG